MNATTFGWQTGVSDRDVFLWTLPMFHCNGWGMSYAVTGMGGRHIVLRKVDGAEILRRVDRHGVTLLCGAPAVVAAVLDAAQTWDGEIPGRGPGADGRGRRAAADEDDRADGDRARLGVHPDLRAHRDVAAAHDEPRPRRVGRLVPRGPRAAAGTCGRARTRRTARRSATRARCSRARTSCSRATGSNPKPRADALEGGWFHTGDGGSLDDEHYLTISDRKKDVIISGGENVSSIEVEDCLYQHPAVAEACVIGVPDEKWGETVMALVVVKSGRVATEPDELIEHCRASLAHFKCPTQIEFRTELARTSTGKLQKFKIREPYWQGRERKVN